MKKILMLSALLLFVAGINAQNFFGPLDKAVKTEQQVLKATGVVDSETQPVFLFRPAINLTADLITFGDDPKSTTFSAIGFGATYGKYVTTSSGNVWCSYSFTGALWTNMDFGNPVDAKMGLSVTGEILNRLVGFGPAVYLDAGKLKAGLVVNLSYRF